MLETEQKDENIEKNLNDDLDSSPSQDINIDNQNQGYYNNEQNNWQQQGYYNNGQNNGQQQGYYNNGQNNGQQQGYYNNGQNNGQQQGYYNNGQNNGQQQGYYNNGQNNGQQQGYYNNGQNNGQQQGYYNNGQNNGQQQGYPKSSRNKIVAGLLGIFFGAFGVHNFYLGYTGKAIIQLLITVLTLGLGSIITSVWSFIESILILTGSICVDGYGNRIVD